MPELPEVENVVINIKHKITHQKILDAIFTSDKKLREHISKEDLLILKNSTIINVERIAKYILIHLSNKYTLIVHLGMSGVLSIETKDYTRHKHQHLEIKLENGNYISYRDTRRFGMLILTNSPNENKYISNCGIEPLSEQFNTKYFRLITEKSKKEIKPFLMDGHIIAGIGNIYASEVLYKSKVLPDRKASALTENEMLLIVKNIKEILQESIKNGGTTFRDYRDASNNKGKNQDTLLVYGQKQCKQCKTKIESFKQSQRTTFYCPLCQL